MYKWWFRNCARHLRLSNFLFGDERKDEEGHHVRRTWSAWLAGTQGNVEEPVIGEDRRLLVDDRETEVYFLFDGKYVKAPASDQVRIPKGQPVFLDIEESEDPHSTKHSAKESSSEDSSSSDNTNSIHNGAIVQPVPSSMPDKYARVYIPPFFRLRIAAFIVTIWLFAAATGVAVTIIPLIFGRFLIATLTTASSKTNDIYAFSIGIYLLGGAIYTACHSTNIISFVKTHVAPTPTTTAGQAFACARTYTLQAARVVYVYGLLAIVLPLAFAAVLEAYFLIPLHTYFNAGEEPVAHLIQDWALGVLYVQIAAGIIKRNREYRLARAAAAVVAEPYGYWNPNVRVATRCFLLPLGLMFAVVLALPFVGAWVATRTVYAAVEDERKMKIMRYAYPLALMLGVDAWVVWSGFGVVGWWRSRIRDEVYLVGERLHNFGEKKSADVGSKMEARA